MRAAAYGVGIALVLLMVGVGAIVVWLLPTPSALPPVDGEAAKASTCRDPATAGPSAPEAKGRVRTPPSPPSRAATGESGATPGIEGTSPGSLLGRIVVSGDGRPVAGVIVTVCGQWRGKRARTTSDGYFRVDDLAPGLYTVSARTYMIPHFNGRIVRVHPGRETAVVIEADPGIRLHGRVTDAVTGRGIVEADVTVRSGGGGRAVESGEDGHYELRGLEVGGRVSVEAEGYAVAPVRYIRGMDDPGELRMDFALMPTAALEGQVVGPEGESVPGAKITVERADGGPYQHYQADETGRFRITRLPARVPLTLQSSGAGYASVRVNVGVLLVNEVRSGVIVSVGRGAVIAGRVLEPDGDTASEGIVRLDRSGAILRGGAWQDTGIRKGGAFRFECVPPGRYTISVRHPEYLLAESVDVEVTEGSRLEAFVIKLDAGLTISGKLVDADGNPVEGSVVAEPADVPSVLLPGIHHQARSNAAGEFEMEALSPGRYRLTAWSQMHHGMDGPDLTVRAGARDVVLHFSKRIEQPKAADGSVEGRVHDPRSGKPIMGFCVSYWRVEGGADQRRPFVDPEGRFRIDNLMPGTYEFEASSSAGRVTREPVRVVLGSSGPTPAIELRLDRGAAVTGRILSPQGAPVAGATIEVMRCLESSWRNEAWVISRPDGRYRAEGLAPGEHLIRAGHPDWIRAERRFAVTVGQTRTIDLELLAAGGSVQVVVRDPAGKPLRDAVVRIQGSDRSDVLPVDHPLRRFLPLPSGDLQPRVVWRIRTDSSGQVVFTRVPPGPYTIQVFKPGHVFRSATTSAYERVTSRVEMVLPPVE